MFRQFLSTLSLRRATRLGLLGWLRVLISIHALLAESDSAPRFTPAASRNFYPRSPCGERHSWRGAFAPRNNISIHALLAESDLYDTYAKVLRVNISIHALLAESDLEQSSSYSAYLEISIHALLAESDNECTSLAPKPKTFLSTLSLRRATILC